VLDDTDTTASNRFNAAAKIVMKKGVAPAGRAQAYDARQLVERLGPTVGSRRQANARLQGASWSQSVRRRS
jgi:hypothetical protein